MRILPGPQASTIAERPTFGTLLAETEKQHQKQQIEVGEYVEEVGKKEYLKQLHETIAKRINDPDWQEKYYLLVYTRKNPVLVRVVEIYVQPRHTRPLPQPGLTLWSYDPPTQALKLEWVLPHHRSFKMFLATEQQTDPFLIECIKKYQKGELV